MRSYIHKGGYGETGVFCGYLSTPKQAKDSAYVANN